MMMMIESSLAVIFRSVTTTACSSSSLFFSGNIRPWWSTDDHYSRLSQAAGSHYHNHHHWTPTRTNKLEKRIRTAAESDNSVGWNGEPNYHPFEEFGASTDDYVLTPAETCRTLIEVNSKATLMFSGMVDNQVHENIFWPDLPYLTDEHGNIYFEVNEDEDILKTITSEENYVQVIIGLDTKEMLSEMELGQAEIDYGMEEIGDEDSNDDDDDGGEGDEGTDDDDYDDEDWVSVLEGDEDETDSDETLGDWAKLETMRFTHPMYFAKKMSEVASDDPMDWMDQSPAGLAIQGLLRPSFFEENSAVRKQSPENNSDKVDINKVGTAKGNSKDNIINGQQDKSSSTDSSEDGSDGADQSGKDLNPRTSFYMLEMANIQLVSSDGNQAIFKISNDWFCSLLLLIFPIGTNFFYISNKIWGNARIDILLPFIPLLLQSVVEVKDFQNAKPDAIAHSADKIMSRLKAGGEKMTQSLKSLCLRVKGIQVEEATVIGVDSLGFDLRVCSGTQVQTLRFAFSSRATSEYSTERQFHELLFPRSQQAAQKRPDTSPTES